MGFCFIINIRFLFHRWFPQLYRAAYGLLCSGGKHLPIIIRDDFSNDDFDDNSVCSHTVES